jgi:hypothetical protein
MRIIIEIDEPDRVSTVVQGRAAEAMGTAPPVRVGAAAQEAAANGAAINAGPAPASVTGQPQTRAPGGEGADAPAGTAAGNAQSAGAARYEGAFQ